MFLGITPFSQSNYITTLSKPQKVNFSLQNHFGLQPQDTFTLQKKEFNEVEKQQYNEILNTLPIQNKKELENLQKNGILLNKKSNNNSSTLDNLYKIYKNERAQGLNNKEILKETISTLNNPYRISQKNDNSSKNYLDLILTNNSQPIKEKTSTCTASCIEFDLASQEPAEFVRFVEELTSPKLSVDKTIELNNLADKALDAIWLLNTFETPKEANSFNKIKLTLKPDDKILEKIALDKSSKTFSHRNTIDTILQSTFMNVGSQQSYNSITDIRGGKFNVTEKGLIEFEKTYTESIVRNKNIISVNYQKIDENGQIVGYETDFSTIKNQLLDTLSLKENIILGLTNQMPDGSLKGHEVVLTGAKTHTSGKTDFYCYNSDSDKLGPEIYSEDYLLSRIHHAGLPKEIVAKTMIFQDGWILGLENFKQLKH